MTQSGFFSPRNESQSPNDYLSGGPPSRSRLSLASGQFAVRRLGPPIPKHAEERLRKAAAGYGKSVGTPSDTLLEAFFVAAFICNSRAASV
jgi:hypothetical protein